MQNKKANDQILLYNGLCSTAGYLRRKVLTFRKISKQTSLFGRQTSHHYFRVEHTLNSTKWTLLHVSKKRRPKSLQTTRRIFLFLSNLTTFNSLLSLPTYSEPRRILRPSLLPCGWKAGSQSNSGKPPSLKLVNVVQQVFLKEPFWPSFR